MRDARILIIVSALISSIAMFYGHEAFATIEVPNLTPDLYKEPIPLEKLAMSALFDAGGQMTAFGLNLTPNSELCPENNCQFSLDGNLIHNSFTGEYNLDGMLKVTTQQATGLSSQLYEVRGNFDTFETFEQAGKITYPFTDGALRIFRGKVYTTLGGFAYTITNGSLVFTPGQASLELMGERPTTPERQSQSSNLTALAQPANTTTQQQQQQQPANTTTQQQQQQQPANTTTQQQQQQQPANTTTLQQQQPVIGQTPLTQLQQSTTTPTLSALQQQQQQQQPLPPQSNISQQLQQLQQQPLPGQVMEQQLPGYQPPLAQQQQLNSIYQQPTSQVPPTIQQLPAQPLMQTSPQTQSLFQGNPAQPYGIPSTTGTIQPQLSALPPTATTFPPSVLPPVNSLQPYGTTGGLGYPSTIGGQYGLGAAGSAAGAAATSVSTSSQLVSPWFPSLPATYCGGTFLLTIEGTPRGNGDKNNIEPSDNNDSKDNNGGGDNNDDDDDDQKNSKDSDRERRLLSLQVNSDNSRIFSDDDAISGEIFLGKNNIDRNKGNDFDIKSIFNDCQVVTYSKA